MSQAIAHTIDGLIQKVSSYNKGADFDLLRRAHNFAQNHHSHQKRASGEPYISHPLAVAHLLADLKLDVSSIMAGLLHDTVEDTSATLEDIKTEFGQEVSYLVDGVTKLSKLEIKSKSQVQAENLRKLVLAMADDIRVLIVKLMDRLHNMQTIQHLASEERRQNIASETLEIYAPLAERIGMAMVQEQLQNLAFSILNPEAYQTILSRIAEFHEKGRDIVQNVIKDLENILKKGGLSAHVYGREKKPYSIWRKMQRKNINFDQLSDLFGVRILVEAKADCYQALGLIHHEKVVIPGTFKDYISTPKPNHYQALHTKVLGPHGTRLEIQIRTASMQEIAERGVAAHWQYKQGVPSKELKNYEWLQGLLDISEQTVGDEEFLEHTKLQMFQDQVFCFTPKGDLINLPRGATVIDFAYAVHSAIGNSCGGARVNGNLASLKTELQNGDLVDVILGKDFHPSPVWEQYAISGKAQANIRRFLKSQKKAQLRVLGQSIYENSLTSSQKESYRKDESRILKHFELQGFDDLLIQLGEGKLSPIDLESVVAHPVSTQDNPSKTHEKIPDIIRGAITGIPLHYAQCCFPVPGDKILGMKVPDKGLIIHRADCKILHNYEKDSKRFRDLSWGATEGLAFHGRLVVHFKEDPYVLGEIITTLAKTKGVLTNLQISRGGKEVEEAILDFQVKDSAHMDRIMGSLRLSSRIQSITRP